MQVYKNREEKKPKIFAQKRIQEDCINETAITMNLHTGTHVDAPYHMQEDGVTIEQLDIRRLITPCRVLDLTHVEDGISKADLEGCNIQESEFLLFKTRNSFVEVFEPEFIYLKACGAEYLVEKGVKGVGIDALGVERAQPGHPTHKTLMGNDILIVEGLRLKEIEAESYTLCALPIYIQGVDGAPARAVLIKET